MIYHDFSSELLRITLPLTRVNEGMKKGRDC